MEWGAVGVAQSGSQLRDLGKGKGFLEMVTFNCTRGGGGGGGGVNGSYGKRGREGGQGGLGRSWRSHLVPHSCFTDGETEAKEGRGNCSKPPTHQWQSPMRTQVP